MEFAHLRRLTLQVETHQAPATSFKILSITGCNDSTISLSSGGTRPRGVCAQLSVVYILVVRLSMAFRPFENIPCDTNSASSAPSDAGSLKNSSACRLKVPPPSHISSTIMYT